MPSRRDALRMAGGALATLAIPLTGGGGAPLVIEMRGSARGERVWFAPLGLAVPAGTTLRFVNRDPGNSHTATAYHPALYERPRRIPVAALPWDSGFLLPEGSFEIALHAPGVHDFYCLPHEHAGMVGRIVVGQPGDPGWEAASEAAGDLSEAALAGFPEIAEILARGRVMPEDRA